MLMGKCVEGPRVRTATVLLLSMAASYVKRPLAISDGRFSNMGPVRGSNIEDRQLDISERRSTHFHFEAKHTSYKGCWAATWSESSNG